MGVRDLFFRITAQDDTKGAFASVRQGLSQVDGAARTMRERFAGTGKAMRNAGAVMTAATAGLVLAGRDMLALFQQQEKAESLVAQAVRQTGEAAGFTAAELFKQASALQELTAVGDETILQNVTGQLLTFGNVTGEVFERAQLAALDLSAVLGSDLKAQTIQLGKALNDPVRGLSALGEAGIQFSADQRELIASLVETGEVAKAQGLILDEISRFYGGQAAASAGTLQGQPTALNNTWGDLKEQFGAVLAELLPPVIEGLKSLVEVVQATPEPMKRLAVGVALFAGAAGPVIGTLGLLTLGLGALSAPVLVAVAGIGALTAAVVAFWPELTAAAEAVGAFVERVRATLVDGFDRAVATVQAFGERVVAVITGKLGEAFDYVSGVVESIGDTFDALYERVVGHSSVPDLVDGVLAEFHRMGSKATDTAETMSAEIGSIFEDLGRGVVGLFADMAQQGSFSLKGLGSGLLSLGGSIAGRIAGKGIDYLVDAGAASLGIPGFAEGADFTVGGRPGRDRNLVAFMASSDERVTVSKPGQRGGGAGVVVNIVTPDPQAFRASSAQVSAQLARAVARGQGRL